MRSARLAIVLGSAIVAGCGPPAEERACSEPGIICPVAGTGEAGFNGDGLAPARTALDLPSVARRGPDGLLYVMDFNNMRLRCLVADGTVDTMAGSGEHAFAVPGADALDSPLESPIDFGFTPEGLMVFVSLHDPRVLRVEADGTLGVVAGTGESGDAGDEGPGSDALFNELAAIAIAPDGTIYVSDEGSSRVRRIAPDGTVHAHAGSGEPGDGGDGGSALDAALAHPQGIALDREGNLYIADAFNHRVRRVDAKTGVIDTVAGNGEGGLSGDGGPASEAMLQWPSGVAVAPDGTLYIADSFNHRVRRVALDGTITTVAGSARGYGGDRGPAIESWLQGPAYLSVTDSELYIADQQNHVIRVVRLAP